MILYFKIKFIQEAIVKKWVIIVLIFITFSFGFTCTTGVYSSKSTKDGKPMLWKNRDSSNKLNQVGFFEDGKYSYFGMVNEGDKAGLDIWAGINEKGFAIMNSASYNVEIPGKPKDGEGRFMKLALQTCSNIKDFENLLKKTEFYRDVNANFGVIDSEGGAAYFETSAESYKMFDANKTEKGFIIRTNYSVSGEKDSGFGFIRKERADFLTNLAVKNNELTPLYLMNNISRDLLNDKTGVNALKNAGTKHHYINASDTINRYSTVSVSLFQGVKKGENPENSIFWALLGNPVCSVALPIFLKSKSVPILMEGEISGKLDEVAVKLQKTIFPFPDKMGSLYKYMDIDPLYGKGENKVSILEKIIQHQNFVDKETKKFDAKTKSKEECIEFQNKLSENIFKELTNLLEIVNSKK